MKSLYIMGACFTCSSCDDCQIICRSTKFPRKCHTYCSRYSSTIQICRIYFYLPLIGPPAVLHRYSRGLYSWNNHSCQDSIFCQRYQRCHYVSHVCRNLEGVQCKQVHLFSVEVLYFQLVVVHLYLLSHV